MSLLLAAVLVGYTNHVGNVVAGRPAALTPTQVTLVAQGAERAVPGAPAPRGKTYPLSIFPESEQRRMAADFGQPRVPRAVKRAVDGAEKAMARSRKRAERGLCPKAASEEFCAKTAAALKAYLDRQVERGTITPAERKALCRH